MLIGELVGDVSTDKLTFEAYKDVRVFDFVTVKNPKDGKEWILCQIDSVKKDQDGKTTCEAQIIGYREKGMLKKPRHVVKPDSMVYRADEDVIAETLGLSQDGLYMGRLETNPDIRIFVNPSDLYKHIAVLAKTGAGKCVSVDTPVLLENGALMPIKEMYADASTNTIRSTEEEELVQLEGIRVQTLDSEMNVSASDAVFGYRKKADTVIDITTASGRQITVSKEHPLLCADTGFSFTQAQSLEEGMAIAIPRKIDSNADAAVEVSDRTAETSKGLIEERMAAVEAHQTAMRMRKDGAGPTAIVEETGIARSTVENWLYNGNSPAETTGDGIVTTVSGKEVQVPVVGTELAEFFAMLIAEGAEQRTSHYRAIFTNDYEPLLNRFEQRVNTLFGLETSEMRDNAVYIDSNALEVVLTELGYETNQRSAEKTIPDIMMRSEQNAKETFLRTYMDCEGCVEDHEVTVSTASSELANQLTYLFAEFGVLTRLRETEKHAVGTNHEGGTYYEVVISGVDNIRRFVDRIGFGMARKQAAAREYVTNHEANTNVDTIPVDGETLRRAREQKNLSQSELADIIGMSQMAISRYENENRKPSQKALASIAEALELEQYQHVTDGEVFWDPIVEIEQRENPDEYVYDLTVSGDHTFIAGRGGIINHNSYANGVLIEELLEQNYPVIIIDPHGEYQSLALPNDELSDKEKKQYDIDATGYHITEYSTDTKINPNAEPLRFSSKNLDAKELKQLIPTNLTNSQLEVLYNSLKELKKRDEYTLEDIKDAVMNQDSKAKWNLINVLEIVQESNLFSDNDANSTDVEDLVRRGHASIVNLKGVDPENQEMVVYKLAKELFDKRKVGEMVPFFMIMEEAHNFVPERNFGKAVCSDVLRTIASEGRKFGMGIGVISQRPARVDKNILSQCNVQLIMRVTNPNDLNAIGRSFEGITSEVRSSITSLPPGVGLVLGKEYPVMTDIRTRRSKHGGGTQELDPEEMDAAPDGPDQPEDVEGPQGEDVGLKPGIDDDGPSTAEEAVNAQEAPQEPDPSATPPDGPDPTAASDPAGAGMDAEDAGETGDAGDTEEADDLPSVEHDEALDGAEPEPDDPEPSSAPQDAGTPQSTPAAADSTAEAAQAAKAEDSEAESQGSAPQESESQQTGTAEPDSEPDNAGVQGAGANDSKATLTAITPALDRAEVESQWNDVKTAYYPIWVVKTGHEKVAVDATDGEIKARDLEVSSSQREVLALLKDADHSRQELLQAGDFSLNKLDTDVSRLVEKNLIVEDGETYRFNGVDIFDREFETVIEEEVTKISKSIPEGKAVSIARKELQDVPEDVELIYYPYYTAGQRVFDAVLAEEI